MRGGKDLWSVDTPRRRDHGAGGLRRLQGHPHRQDPHPDQPADRRTRGTYII